MRISVLLAAGPNHPAAAAALRHCQALIKKGATLSVFFYQDGVLLSQRHLHSAPSETSVALAWQTFIQQQQINAIACTASAVRRGIFDSTAAAQYQQPETIASDITLGGLGEWAQLIQHSHKVISFQQNYG